MPEKLLNCPFCGGDDSKVLLIGGLFKALCPACKASTGLYNTEAEAITAWNQRQPDNELVEALEETKKLEKLKIEQFLGLFFMMDLGDKSKEKAKELKEMGSKIYRIASEVLAKYKE